MTRRSFASAFARTAAALLFAACAAFPAQQSKEGYPVRSLDDFADIAPWQVVASEDVRASIRRDTAGGRPAVRVLLRA